jgi:methionine-rich copper-binding protein CopC
MLEFGMQNWMTGAAVALLASSMAMAHSPLESTEPSDGAVLAGAPEVIRLEFAGPIRLVGVALSGNGAETALDVPSAGAARFEVATPDLAPGRYRVEWRGMAGDGHVMSGAFSFEVE